MFRLKLGSLVKLLWVVDNGNGKMNALVLAFAHRFSVVGKC